MNKKVLISITMAVVLSVIVFGGVLAGITRDRGTLESGPPAASASWTAWISVYESVGGSPTLIFPPQEILTEDSYNAAQGQDGGYTDAGWQIQVENFSNESKGIPVNMAFCGLYPYAGLNWEYDFNWDGTNESTTNHGEVPLISGSSLISPSIDSVEVVGDTKVVSFSGVPETTYQVYRSTSPASQGSDQSNGRYKRQGEVTTDGVGFGTFVDSTTGIASIPSWYVVMYFANNPTGQHGCHSEDLSQTSSNVIYFSAAFNDVTEVVDLAWETALDDGITEFAILRGTSANLGEAGIIEDHIPVNNPGGAGSSYEYHDNSIAEGETYYYWLKVVTDTGIEYIGPRMVYTLVLEYDHFLPLIIK